MNEDNAYDASCQSPQNQHGQKKTAGNAAAVTNQRKQEFACQQCQKQLQRQRQFVQTIDQVIAAAQYLRKYITQHAGCQQCKGDAHIIIAKYRQFIKIMYIQQTLVKNNTGQANHDAQQDGNPNIFQGKRRQNTEVKYRFSAKDNAADYR